MPSRIGSSVRGGGGGEVLVLSRMSENGEAATRARALKPHESEPFLTIGLADINTYGPSERSSVTLPVEGSGSVTARGRPGSGNSHRSEGHGDRSTVTSTGAVLYSLYMSQSISMGKENRGSEGASGTGRTGGSTLPSSRTPNPCVKMPFKHNIRKPSQAQWQEPAQELKEMTALATYHVTQQLLGGGSGGGRGEEGGGGGGGGGGWSQRQRGGGRLQKGQGRLKPLYPVHLTGPSISQCRGILAETRAYSASTSKTLQRRRQIVSQIRSGALKLAHNKQSPQANDNDEHEDDNEDDDNESVHRVSAASSVEDLAEEVGGGRGGRRGGRGGEGEEEEKEEEEGVVALSASEEDFQAELACMEQDALLSAVEMEEKESPDTEQTEKTKEKDDIKETASTPLSLEQDILIINSSHRQNPDLSTPCPPAQPSEQTPADDKTDPADDASQPSPAVTTSTLTVTIASKHTHFTRSDLDTHSQGAEKPDSALTHNSDPHSEEKKKTNGSGSSSFPHAARLKSRRPVSAAVLADSSHAPLSSSPLQLLMLKQAKKTRPQTAAAVKLVRFAERAHSSDGKTVPVSRANSWTGRGKRAEEEEEEKR